MRRLALLLLPSLVLAAPPAGYELDWADEFDGADWSRERWALRALGADAAPVRAEAVRVSDGKLHLDCRRLEDGTIVTGALAAKPHLDRAFGYYEASARVHRHNGHHSAFWLQSRLYGRYPGEPARQGAEIEIFEWFGPRLGKDGLPGPSALAFNIYWDPYGKDKDGKSLTQLWKYTSDRRGANLCRDVFGSANPADRFVTWGFEWTPEGYAWFVDGKEAWRTSTAVSKVPQYVILSTKASPWERSLLPLDQLPDSNSFDYVRVYRRAAPAAAK